MRVNGQRIAALCAVLFLLGTYAIAAPTAEQRAEILSVGTLLTKAGNLYKESKFKESGEVIKDVQNRLEKLAGAADEATLNQLEPLHQRMTNAHKLLETKGVTLPKLAALPEKPAVSKTVSAKPAPAAPTKAAKTAGKSLGGPVSFVKDVAPVLNARCGKCHIEKSSGRFSMASYEALMKGPPAGKVVFPANVPGSDLIVKVQDKEMPPNGAGIPDGELATLKRWVEEGAKFDGSDPASKLTSFITGGNQPAPTPAITIQSATGSESVSFAKDIAPIFVDNCLSCHGADNPQNAFSLNTMAGLMKGGDRGEPILPGKPADSMIIKKLRGTADGMRMPARRPPLDSAKIVKIEKWIEEGARFDGPDTAQPISEVILLVKALNSSHQELSADRVKLAEDNWRLGLPGVAPNRSESTNFFVLGNLGESNLAEIAKKAESLAPKVAETFRAPKDQALIKGRMTLFVFGERYDYGEFGKMVEKRDLSTASRGHFRYSIVDAYGAVLAPRSGDYSLDALIAQQLAAVYVSAQGKGVPRWFAEGCGRVVASRLATGADSRLAKWDDELAAALTTMKAPDDFLTTKVAPEQADVCAFSFVKFLMADRRFGNLIDGLRKGGDFQKVFAEIYGGTPTQLATMWVRNPPKSSKRGK